VPLRLPLAWNVLLGSFAPFLGLVQLVGAGVVLVGIALAQTARAGKVVDADLALDLPAPEAPSVRGAA
jgi:hypothetical protein